MAVVTYGINFPAGLLLAFLVSVATVVEKSDAATYVVGDALGWTIPSGGAASYASWAANHTFVSGDVLVFNFPTGIHDVAKVDKASFDSCSATNPTNLITLGPANVTLTAGPAYYICTFGNHCSAGQKLAINVSESSSTTPSPSPSVPAPSPSITPTPTPAPPTPTPTPTPVPTPPTSAPSPTPAGGSPTPAPSPSPSTSPSSSPSPSPTGSSPPAPPPSGPAGEPPESPAPGTEAQPPPSPSSTPATTATSAAILIMLLSIAVSILY